MLYTIILADKIMPANQKQYELSFGVNVKIIAHWIIVVSIMILLMWNISINVFAFSIFLVFFILTLSLNRTSFIKLTDDRLEIVKKNFLFISTFRKRIEFRELTELNIIDNRIDNLIEDPIIGGYGDTLIKLLTGTFFYTPRYNLLAVFKSGERLDVWVNTQRFEMKKLIKQLETIPDLDKVLKVSTGWKTNYDV
ncbi:MAG TPA: hypothetical protein VK205_02430 [Prolixibacteraceae bacterium]|nr:hypothetical protein [Prolixibacteraceae bacterium]